MSIRVIILDFDGVVVESVHIKHEAFSLLLPEHPEHTEAIMHYHASHNAVSRYVKFRHIVEEIVGEPYDTTVEAELKRRFDALTRERIVQCPYVPGALEFLQYFVPRLPIYLASATPLAELCDILEQRGLRRYFRDVYGAPSVKSTVLHEVLQKERVAAADSIFIGDSVEDWRAAEQAGVPFLGKGTSPTFGRFDGPVVQDLTEAQAWITARAVPCTQQEAEYARPLS